VPNFTPPLASVISVCWPMPQSFTG
jgi:hypothetical protein